MDSSDVNFEINPVNEFSEMTSLTLPEVPSAFSIFSKENQKRMSENFPNEPENMILARLGEVWRSMPETVKEIYYLKAGMMQAETNPESKIMEGQYVRRHVPFPQFPFAYPNQQVILNCNEKSEVKTKNLSPSQTFKSESSSVSNPTIVYLSKEKDKEKSSKVTLSGEIQEQSQKNIINQESPSFKIPRPPNAFMIFGKEYRRLLSQKYTNETNKSISVRLGQLWRQLSAEVKEEYFKKAKLIELQHRKKYPDYEYNPFLARKRKEQIKLARINKSLSQNKLKSKAKSHIEAMFPGEQYHTKSGINFLPNIRPQSFPFHEPIYPCPLFTNGIPIIKSLTPEEVPYGVSEYIEIGRNSKI
ncbi:uncharacterized protein [Centruroides vittatus]|uniref:uncharacterized protein isoform X1 n=2 Tax=Centruroides vittatus TaxID=120091 RepID=UPI00350EBB18